MDRAPFTGSADTLSMIRQLFGAPGTKPGIAGSVSNVNQSRQFHNLVYASMSLR